MSVIFGIQDLFQLVLSLGLLAFEAWAFLDALSHKPDAFVAGDKQTKQLWLIVLGVALGAHLLIMEPFHLLNLVGAVATIVYFVDVRPTLRSLTRR